MVMKITGNTNAAQMALGNEPAPAARPAGEKVPGVIEALKVSQSAEKALERIVAGKHGTQAGGHTNTCHVNEHLNKTLSHGEVHINEHANCEWNAWNCNPPRSCGWK